MRMQYYFRLIYGLENTPRTGECVSKVIMSLFALKRIEPCTGAWNRKICHNDPMFKQSQTLKLFASALLLALTACATNPVTGHPEFNLVSDKKANKMGSDAYPSLRQQWGGDYNDPELQEWISSIGMELAKNSHSPELPYKFTVTNSSQLNAVCLPGGKIFITRGLLSELENEAQVAAVLGHEVGHATARHAEHSMSRGMVLQAAVFVGSVVLNQRAKSRSERLIGQLGLNAAMFGTTIATMKYGRDNEYQADELGVIYMMKSGYDPDGAIEVQQILASKEKTQPTYFQALMRSHPVSDERVKHITRFVYENEAGYGINRKGDGKFAERFKQKTAHLMVSTKAFEHYHKANKDFKEGRTGDAVRENNQAIAIDPNEAEFYIQKGDFAVVAKKYDNAENAYNKAKDIDSGYYKVHERLGHLAKLRGRNDDAIAHHEKSIKLNPTAGNSFIESGYAYLEKKDYDNATAMFEAGTKVQPSNGRAFTTLGQLYEKEGRHEDAYSAYQIGAKRSSDKESKDFATGKVERYQQFMR